ncbi:MAG TPA: MFS transporter [Gemmataceae bacterium]|nr:MFS transporter [Gemmataceae bacterium]
MSTAKVPPSYFKWWICVLLLLASALNYMDRQALSLTAVRVSEHFELSNFRFSWFESGFSLGFLIGAPLVGWLVDRGNARWIYPAVVFAWSAAGFLSGFAESFAFLLGCRIALGLFEGGNIPCGVVTVKRVLRPEERALGNGMFQSGSAVGAIVMPLVVLLCLSYLERSPLRDQSLYWRLPFWVVGSAGLLWVGLWLLSVRTHHVRSPQPTASADEPVDTYWAIWGNRRFWVSLVVVLAINSTWRSFVFWLPKFLQQGKGYDEKVMAWLTSGFYVAADLGTIAVGAAVLWLHRHGLSLHRARLFCYAGCAGLTALSVLTALFPRGPALVTVLFLLGFGTLGLFPIYYNLSQEISVRHQGKVTGTLSCLNAMYLLLLFPVQGKLIDQLGSFSAALGMAGVFPLAGLVALTFFWEPRQPRGSELGPQAGVPPV